MAPVAAHLSLGLDPARLGSPYTTTARPVARRVRHDPHEPRPERPGRIVSAQVPQGRKERVLCRIIGIVLISQNGPRYPARGGGVSPYQLTERLPVSRLGKRGELGIRHTWSTHLPAVTLTLSHPGAAGPR